MKMYVGSTRRVFVVGPFAFKFARTNPWRALRETWSWMFCKRGDYLSRIAMLGNYTDEMLGSPQLLLLRGIGANLRERSFYKKHRLPILMPTYCTIFGLVNIQKAGSPLVMKDIDPWCCIREISDCDKAIFVDGHTFSEPPNFAKVDGKLMLLDYGSSGCRKFLLKWGDEIYKNFDFNFDWDKFKKLRYPPTTVQEPTITSSGE